MCRLGAIEVSKMYEILDKKYANSIKIFGFGPNDLSLDDFKEKKFFPYPIFIPKIGSKFYDKFQLGKPRCCSCFAFCDKKVIKRYDEAKKLNTGYTLKGSLSQLGGSFIINHTGKVVFSHFDQYLGDTCPIDEVIKKFESLLEISLPKDDQGDSSKRNLVLTTEIKNEQEKSKQPEIEKNKNSLSSKSLNKNDENCRSPLSDNINNEIIAEREYSSSKLKNKID